EWVPPSWGDARAAWTGTASDATAPLRVEATAYHGRPTFFVVAGAWTVKPGTTPEPPAKSQIVVVIIAMLLMATPLVAGVLMARWSIKTGRADRRGGARLTTFVAIVQIAASWLVMTHVAGPAEI